MRGIARQLDLAASCKTYGMTAPPLSDALAGRATLLAMCVRNAMEGTVHGGELGRASLTDEQMAALNPIVRNAIATGLHAEFHYFRGRAARSYLDFQSALVPTHWERPELLDDYQAVVGSKGQRAQGGRTVMQTMRSRSGEHRRCNRAPLGASCRGRRAQRRMSCRRFHYLRWLGGHSEVVESDARANGPEELTIGGTAG